MPKQEAVRTKVLSLVKAQVRTHMEKIAVRDTIEEEFYKVEALVGSLAHIYQFRTGEEMNQSHTSAVLSLIEDHMGVLKAALDMLPVEKKEIEDGIENVKPIKATKGK